MVNIKGYLRSFSFFFGMKHNFKGCFINAVKRVDLTRPQVALSLPSRF
jgi:hypothetical protein